MGRLKNAAAEGLFNDGKGTTILTSAECSRCGCVAVANGFSSKEPDVPGCDCNCHETWRFIHRRPVS